ncbi:MAG: glycosyltransferase involved in cell wall biosynthesis [Colwellia sp.]
MEPKLTESKSHQITAVTSRKKLLIVVPKAFLPELTGGLEISAYEVAKLYILQDFEVHVAAGTLGKGSAKVLERIRRKVFGGYSDQKKLHQINICTDLWHPIGLEQLVKRLNPSGVLFFTSGTDDVTSKIIKINLPTAIFLCGVKMSQKLRDTNQMTNCEFICESSFISEQAQLKLGVTARKISPLMPRQKYSVTKTGNKILVVNPNPEKGGAIILKIAKEMSHRQFLVVGGWQHESTNSEINDIENGLKALPNVQRLPNTEDMKPIFEQSYCLLMPCIVEEAYGRIAAEVQISGLPVIASTQGALAETVGEGGITMDYLSPIATWVTTLESLFCDTEMYKKLSLLAITESNKPERQASFIKDKLSQLIADLTVKSNDK